MDRQRVCEWQGVCMCVGGGQETVLPSELSILEKIKSLLERSPLHPPPRRQVGPKKQLAAFNLGTYVNEVGN